MLTVDMEGTRDRAEREGGEREGRSDRSTNLLKRKVAATVVGALLHTSRTYALYTNPQHPLSEVACVRV